MDMHYTASGVLVVGRAGRLPVPPALLANIVLRLVLSPLAVLLTWVPLRLLWRHGEFPACVLVVDVWLLVLAGFVNAALWHDQDFDRWWLGYGWCDLQAFVMYPLHSVFAASVCAIMQRLAGQVGLVRVTGLSPRERRRRLLVQALIVFPLPLLQLALAIFVQGQRYGIAPVVGCTSQYYPTAVFLVFFVLPPMLFTLAACFFAFQTYRRFREVEAGARAALDSANAVAFARRQRARRKLYFMVVCILVPYAPITVALCALNLVEGWPWNFPSAFRVVHGGPGAVVPWNSISLMSAGDLGALTLNITWIPVASAFVAFVFFGTSKEALNVYRELLLALGLGRCLPGLREVYDPDCRSSRRRRGRGGGSGGDGGYCGSSNLDSTASTTVGTQLSTLSTLTSTTTADRSRKGSLAASSLPPAATDEDGLVSAAAPAGRSSPPRRWFGGGGGGGGGGRRGNINKVADPERQDTGVWSAVSWPLPVATSPPVRTPFYPGLRWFMPFRGGGGGGGGGGALSASPAPPFDGTADSNSILEAGGRLRKAVFRTHVWSDRAHRESAANLGSGSSSSGGGGTGAEVAKNGGGPGSGQQGVRVEQCITSEVTG